MRVFLTGATGLIGTALVPELINAGHRVLGLSRSDAGARTLLEAGAEVLRGSIEDQHILRAGADQSDGIIHCAFDHDFSKFAENAKIEKDAITTFGATLAGSDRPLVVSSGLGLAAAKRPVTEDVDEPAVSPYPRIPEQVAREIASQGANVIVVRLPQVHNAKKQGLITNLVAVARQKNVSAYVGEGLNRWPAAHVGDVAHLYRLALEKREPARYHAVAEEGISLRDIADAIGEGLRVPSVSIAPEEALAHFGFVGTFAGMDLSASSARTRQQLGWFPTGPGLIEDLNTMHY